MKYCQFCGRQLNDDEICGCPESQSYSRGRYDIRQWTVLPRFGFTLRDPAGACEQMSEDGSYQESLALMIIQGLVVALAATLVASQLNSLLTGIGMPDGKGISLFKTFLLTLVLSLAMSALTSLSFFGIGKLLGSGNSLMQSFILISVRSAATTVINAVCCLLLLLSVYWGCVLVMLVGTLVTANYLALASNSAPELGRNRALALSVLTAAARAILLMLFIRLFALYYLPDYMREAITDPSSALGILGGFI